MDIKAEKLDIIQWLAGISDSNVIKQFMMLKKSNQENVNIVLTQAEKDAIDKGLQSIKEGRSKIHDEVLEATRQKYPHLFK